MAILGALSLAAALACGGTMVGCGGGDSGGTNPQDSGTDTSTNFDTGVDTSTGPDTGPKDSSTPDTFVAADTGTTEGGGCTATLGAPAFNPAAGSIPQGSTVTIVPPTPFPAGAAILYTNNGTVPGPNNPQSLLYSGPIQINANVTLNAVAAAVGYCTSSVASATYKVTVEAGTLLPPAFNPTSQTQPNDFLVALSSTPGATICFTEDGSQPTCTAGACTGVSQAYNSSSRVSINGTVTSSTTGQVTVTAMACEAGFTDSTTVSQQYTLQAAPPQMLNPLPATNIPWVPNGFTPTISSITVASIAPVNTPTIWATINGAAPSCITGTALTNPTTFGVTTGTAALTGNTVYKAITCKTGYLPSPVVTYAYTIQLNAPGLTGGTFNYAPSLTVGANGITDSNNLGGTNPVWDWLCGTTDGTAAGCGATSGNCTGTATAPPFTVGSKTSATTTVNVVACGANSGAPGGLNNSAPGTAAYTLQYAPGFISTQNSAPPAPQPGWDWPATGQPTTAVNIPASVGTNPYGPFNGWQVLHTPCTAGDTTTTAGTCSGAPAFTVPDFFCWAKNAAAACPPVGTNACDTTAGGNITNGGTLTGATVLATDKISIIACENAPLFPPTEVVYNSSAVTTVTFSGPGQATTPTISAPASNPYTQQAVVTIQNNDTTAGGSAICVSYSQSGVTPTCDAAGANCTTVCPGTDANCVVTGTHLSPPINGPASITTLPAGANDGTGPSPTPGIVQIDGYILKAVACNGTEAASPAASQTFHFAGAEPDISTFNAYSSGIVGDLNNPTTIGAGQTVYLTSTSNYDSLPVGAKESIHWATGAAVNCGSAGQVDLQKVTFGSPVRAKLFDVWDNGEFTQVPGPVPVAPTAGTTWTLSAVTCGQSTQVQQTSAVRTVTYQLTAAQPVITSNQDPLAPLGKCGGAGQPTCCVATPTGPNSFDAPSSCTVASTWENTAIAYISSPTPGNSICWSTVGPPTCSAAGVCGGGSTQASSPVTVPITASPTTLYVLGCSPGGVVPPSAGTSAKFDLVTTPAVVVPSGPGGCSPNPFIELATSQNWGQTGSCTAISPIVDSVDLAQGGPSTGACLCYTTDGTSAKSACNASTCPATPTVIAGTSATCFQAGGGNATCPENSITLSSSATINWATCSAGLDTNAGAPLFSLAPYRETILVDGNLNEWDQNTYQISGSNDDARIDNNAEFGPNGESAPFGALLTYDANNVYFAFDPQWSTAGQNGYTGDCCNNTYAFCAFNGLHASCYPNQYSYMAVYIGNGVSGGGATGDLNPLDPGAFEVTRALPASAGIQYGFLWRTDNGAPITTFKWNSTTGAWAASVFTVNVAYNAALHTVEFGVPQSGIALTPTSTFTAFGTIVGDVGDGWSNVIGTGRIVQWPGNGDTDRNGNPVFYDDFWKENLASCTPPSFGQFFDQP